MSFRFFFFFNDTATTEIYTLSLHDALPISRVSLRRLGRVQGLPSAHAGRAPPRGEAGRAGRDAEWAPVGGRLVGVQSHRARVGIPESPHVRGMRRSHPLGALRDLLLPRHGVRDGPDLKGRPSG